MLLVLQSRDDVYLAGFEAGGVHIDGRKQVLKEGGSQLQMLLATKIIHHHQWCSLQVITLS